MTTNQNNKKKNTAARKLIPAIGMLTVSAMMLSSSTYAWFTMNKVVEVTGMEVKTKVGNNLLICDDNVEANYSSETLSQGRKALLEPVSSKTATTGSFFYTTDAAADGHKITAPVQGTNSTHYFAYAEATNTSAQDAAAGKSYYDKDFNDRYGVTTYNTTADFATAYGYVDYVFYLKATSDADNEMVRMTGCNLLYYNTASGTATATAVTDKAWRAAVFVSDITANGGKGNTGDYAASVGGLDPAASGNAAKAVLTLSSAANHDGTVVENGYTKAAPSPAYNTWDAANIGKIATAGSTAYYKVTVRLWLEGEDTTCTSATYALLKDSYKLDLEFKIDQSTAPETAVTNITSTVPNA